LYGEGLWAQGIIVTLGMIAISEFMRAVCRVNLAFGIWLVSAPFVLDYVERASGSIVSGIAAMCLAVQGTLSERFGGGWTELWRQAE